MRKVWVGWLLGVLLCWPVLGHASKWTVADTLRVDKIVAKDSSVVRVSALQILATGTSDSVKATNLWVGNGSASAPSVAGLNDRNTGFFWLTNDTLAFATAGTERGRIIGNQWLFPNGSAAAPSLAGVNDPNTGLYWLTNDTLALAVGGANWGKFYGSTLQANSALTIAAGGTNQNITLTPSGTGYTLLNGNVGIGTTTFGTSAAGVVGIGAGTAATTSPADMTQLWSADYAAGDARLYIMGEASTNKVIIGNGEVRTDGDATIGDQLIVSGAGPHAIGGAISTNNAINILGSYGGNSGEGTYVGTSITQTITGKPSAGRTLRGAVISPTFVKSGAGETTPFIFDLAVYPGAITGDAALGSTSTVYISAAHSATVTGANYTFWVDGGAVRMDDSLSVGTGAKPTALLELGADNAVKPTTNTWTIASDRRIKKDIRSFTEGLAVLDKINPVYYKYNGQGGFKVDGKENIGVIAQEIQKVAPYTVDTYKAKLNPGDREPTDLLNYNGHALAFVTINAIKELHTQLLAQQQMITALQQDIAALKKRKVN